MDTKELAAAAEGILFAAGEPVHIDRICMALETSRDETERALQSLGDYYAFERRGIRLLHMEDSWQLCSAPDYAAAIRRAFEVRRPAKLSQPALEVLAAIAYYQPTTRAYVDQIRGVDSAYTVGLLLERKLIEECGRLQVPGRPRLFCGHSTWNPWMSCHPCQDLRRKGRCIRPVGKSPPCRWRVGRRNWRKGVWKL